MVAGEICSFWEVRVPLSLLVSSASFSSALDVNACSRRAGLVAGGTMAHTKSTGAHLNLMLPYINSEGLESPLNQKSIFSDTCA